MNDRLAQVKTELKPTSVAEAAKKLHQDLRDRGHYDATRLKQVFGDPRKSVAVESVDDTCAAFLARKRA